MTAASVTIIETTTDEQCVQAALAWCQEHGYRGGRLPRGERFMPDRCPLSQATGFLIDPVFGGYDHEGVWHPFGELVRTFIKRYDSGGLPEFDIEAGEA